jgi:hypothetical protein
MSRVRVGVLRRESNRAPRIAASVVPSVPGLIGRTAGGDPGLDQPHIDTPAAQATA